MRTGGQTGGGGRCGWLAARGAGRGSRVRSACHGVQCTVAAGRRYLPRSTATRGWLPIGATPRSRLRGICAPRLGIPASGGRCVLQVSQVSALRAGTRAPSATRTRSGAVDSACQKDDGGGRFGADFSPMGPASPLQSSRLPVWLVRRRRQPPTPLTEPRGR